MSIRRFVTDWFARRRLKEFQRGEAWGLDLVGRLGAEAAAQHLADEAQAWNIVTEFNRGAQHAVDAALQLPTSAAPAHSAAPAAEDNAAAPQLCRRHP